MICFSDCAVLFEALWFAMTKNRFAFAVWEFMNAHFVCFPYHSVFHSKKHEFVFHWDIAIFQFLPNFWPFEKFPFNCFGCLFLSSTLRCFSQTVCFLSFHEQIFWMPNDSFFRFGVFCWVSELFHYFCSAVSFRFSSPSLRFCSERFRIPNCRKTASFLLPKKHNLNKIIINFRLEEINQKEHRNCFWVNILCAQSFTLLSLTFCWEIGSHIWWRSNRSPNQVDVPQSAVCICVHCDSAENSSRKSISHCILRRHRNWRICLFGNRKWNRTLFLRKERRLRWTQCLHSEFRCATKVVCVLRSLWWFVAQRRSFAHCFRNKLTECAELKIRKSKAVLFEWHFCVLCFRATRCAHWSLFPTLRVTQ